jgi:hypothetical protein
MQEARKLEEEGVPPPPAQKRVKREDEEDRGEEEADPHESRRPPVYFPDMPEDLYPKILGFMGVQDLCQWKRVSRSFQGLCEEALEAKKKTPNAGIFRSTAELRAAVQKLYMCKYWKQLGQPRFKHTWAEQVARKHGLVMNRWNVAQVTNFSQLFQNLEYFNEDISGWDVGMGTSFCLTFDDAVSFSGDLSRWNVSQARNMLSMFRQARSFNCDISNWDVYAATDMGGMFSGASSFRCNLSSWAISNETSIERMFEDTPSSFSLDIFTLTLWNTIVENRFRGIFGSNLNEIRNNHPRWTQELENQYLQTHGRIHGRSEGRQPRFRQQSILQAFNNNNNNNNSLNHGNDA